MLKIIWGLLLLVLGTAASAQPEDPTLLRMLALVPDSADTRDSLISYTNYRALEQSQGIQTPTADDIASSTENMRHWVRATMRLASGMPLNYVLIAPDETEQLMGFSFFDLDSSLTFGDPPSQGLILSADFDAERIADAYEARDYSSSTVEGVTVWCGPAGCDEGQRTDFSTLNPANLFGGHLGRQEPLALLPDGDLLANSASYEVFQAMLAAHQGEQPALADAPEIRAIVDAASEQGEVIQLQLVSPTHFLVDNLSAMLPGGGDDAPDLAELTADYGPLPLYAQAAFADVWDGDDYVTLVLLPYANPQWAEMAADELAQRFENYVMNGNRPFQEFMERLDAVPQDPIVYSHPDTDIAVAVWSMRYPVFPEGPEADGTPPSSAGFRGLIDALYSRSLYVLAPSSDF